MLSDAGHPTVRVRRQARERDKRKRERERERESREARQKASPGLMNVAVYIYRLGTTERAAGRRRIPPLSNNFIFAFNAPTARWDRATAACRPSRWRFLILDKTMQRPVARFRALLLFSSLLFTRSFHSSSSSFFRPFVLLDGAALTGSPSLFPHGRDVPGRA